MNKYLLMSAAAAMASAGSVAAPSAVAGTSIGYSGFCDGLSINSFAGGVNAGQHLFTGCGSTPGHTYFSVTAKSKTFNNTYGGGKKFEVVETYSLTTFSYGYAIQLPAKSGNHWTGFVASASGATAWEYNAGTYFTGYSANHKASSGKKPTNAALGIKVSSK